ncbi:ASCH domain-containing protein [Candidatus Bathyarchaeota archaeon]|nr:ASCH domain-containing protein [Candidatus Bathyarchaeota archaeon]
MILFKSHLIARILQKRKTQTRRLHKRKWQVGRNYAITDRWFSKPKGHIRIKRLFQQRLGDVSEDEAKAEGYESLADFQEDWKAITGYWNPDETVTAYEFELVG